VSEHGHRLHFDEYNTAICPESGEKYRLENQSVQKL
jgi:UDP-2-acetamido-3-amino-2,3-dideoxy-glucuronate N-acetyltransferase